MELGVGEGDKRTSQRILVGAERLGHPMGGNEIRERPALEGEDKKLYLNEPRCKGQEELKVILGAAFWTH